MKKTMLLFIMIGVTVIISGCAKESKVVKIAHKNFTEQRILGQMMAVIIEDKTGMKTEVIELGGTNIALEALKSGDIHMYPEYTGTAYGAILEETDLKNPEEVYQFVKRAYKEQFNIEWMQPLKFNNTYTFAVRPEIAEKYSLKNFSDLSLIADQLVFVSTTEFLERTDGLPGVKNVYGGFEFKETRSMDPGIRYKAIEQKNGDLMDAFATDGKLIEFELVVLEDDKNFFPPYYVAPIVNGEFAKDNKEVTTALLLLGNLIDNVTMQKMNYEVDTLGANERKVAEEFLRNAGIIE